MTPDLIFFGIKSLVRLSQQGQRALIEYAADRPVEFPDIKKIRLADPQDAINRILALPRYAPLTASEPFKSLWNTGGEHLDNAKWTRLSNADQADKLLLVINAARGDAPALALVNDDGDNLRVDGADALSGFVVVEQWKPENKPVSPLGRMALAIVEVALDYVAADPTVLGAGKSGEKVIKSFALALGGPLAAKLDAASLGPQSQIAGGLLTAFVGAGLETLKAHSGDLVSEEHLAKLLDNVLDPVIEAVNGGDALFSVRLQRMLDALAGPAAAAAMKTVADNPGAFFGRSFDSSKAAGAVVSSMLLAAAKDGNVRVTFADHGLLKVLAAALQVAAEKPGLFIKVGEDKDKIAALVFDLTAMLAKELKAEVDALANDRAIDGRALGAGIAAAAIEAIGRQVDVIGAGQPWNEVAQKLARSVLAGLVVAIKDPQGGAAFKQVLSEEKLIAFGRILIDGIVANPRLLGNGDAKVGEVIGAIAGAIDIVTKAKKQFLFTPDGWLDLVRVMTAELVARGPAAGAGADPRLQQIVAALGAIIVSDKNSVLSGADVTTIARTMLIELAGRPLLFGGLKDEINNVAQAVARAIAQDPNLILSGSDWVEILKVAAAEASANPARLFGPAYNTNAGSLAADVTGVVVVAITQLLKDNPQLSGLILKGELIREATIAIVRAASGVPERAKASRLLLGIAVKDASRFVATNAGRYGSNEWLRLISILTRAILDGKHDARLAELENPAAIVRLISGPADVDALLAGEG